FDAVSGRRRWRAAVGGRVKGVTLVSSRMDGSLDASAALGYMEWTMAFQNASPMLQEGRAELALPPGAVVSRATLWINGEEREAAFGARSQVRAAYERVVKQNRDPLLVTTAGADRVLVQLFPIPAGGEMKIRIGITAPMTTDGPNGVQLQLPAFSERNFELAPQLHHAVWFESATPLAGSAELRTETGPGGLSAVRGMLAEPAPGQPLHAIEAPGVMPA
ncbi:MAG: VIT domain-containing protein, partial [Telluria sp.]